MNTTLHDILARARSTPAHPALKGEAGLTYLAFGDLAVALGSFHARMQAAGVKPGIAVALRVADPIVQIIAVLSLMSCGATWARPGEPHQLEITDAANMPGALRIDASWFATGAPAPEDLSTACRMRHNGVEFDAAAIDQRVRTAVSSLPTLPGVTTVCASRFDSMPVIAYLLGTLAAGGAVVFAAPDPASLVQMATLAQARIAIAPADLVAMLAAIMRSGEPLDLCFDAVLVEGPSTPENFNDMRITCARHVVALA